MIKYSSPSTEYSNKSSILKVIKDKDLIKGKNFELSSKYLQRKINSNFLFLTQSGSDALEVCFKLLNLKDDDEVIIPSYTFSATANSVVLNGAKPVFCDVNSSDLCINLNKAEKLISKKTKAICLVHYGGNSCDMKHAIFLKKKYKLYLIEDAAHALFAKYKNKYCGTIGDLGAYSFHATKNFTSGQGGAISINNKKFIKRSKIILNKGNGNLNSNKHFFQWKDVGSEYQMSELSASLLYNQLLKYKNIQLTRKYIFNEYLKFFNKNNFKHLLHFSKINQNVSHSFHIFYLIFKREVDANNFILFMKKKRIEITRHYFPLHMSKFGKIFKRDKCNISQKVYNKITRLPIHTSLKKKDLKYIIKNLNIFFKK